MANIIGEPLPEYTIKQINARQQIHGKGVPDYNSNQISNPRTLKDLAVLNSNTAWVKLASGVSVSSGKIAELVSQGLVNQNYQDTGLAKNFVLFGGTSYLTDSSDILQPRFGISREGNYGAYGFGYGTLANNSNLGYVPMPGIESVAVKTLNRGSIKKATIKIKAHSKVQFDIIDVLYMRLGYSVLLEWGNSSYFDSNNGDYDVMGPTLTETEFFKYAPGSTTYLELLPTIEGLRSAHSGNYDAVLGKISNFNWTFNPDGSYDISIDVISLGDVIESLKTNISFPNKIASFIENSTTLSPSSTPISGSGDTDLIEDNKSSNIISSHLWLWKYLDGISTNSTSPITVDVLGDITTVGQFLRNSNTSVTTIEDMTLTKYVTQVAGQTSTDLPPVIENYSQTPSQNDQVIKNYEDAGWGIDPDQGVDSPDLGVVTIRRIVVKRKPTETITNPLPNNHNNVFKLYISPESSGYYMDFRYLLNFIKDKVLPKIKNTTANIPIFNIDTAFSGKNIMYTLPNQMSLDPKVCLVRNDNFDFFDGSNTPSKFYPELKQFQQPSSKGGFAWAYPLNIYLNFEFIINCLDQNSDERGDVALFGFISSICSGLNEALGGINNLEPIIDESTNSLKIIDSTPIPNSPTGRYTSYKLLPYGYDHKSDESTFIRNIDLKTAITPEYASMVTIGATAGGYVKGIEATSFAKWNKGITDRFKESYVPGDETFTTTSEGDAIENYTTQYLSKGIEVMGISNATSIFTSFTTPLFPPFSPIFSPTEFDQTTIDKNKSVVTEFYKTVMADASQKDPSNGSASSVGFIPFKLGLTMDGLSGIKIYNSIQVDTTFFPSNYPDVLNFIVTGVNHKLQNNDWETEIETMVIPKNVTPIPALDLKGFKSIVTSGGKSGGPRPSTCPTLPPLTPAKTLSIADFTALVKSVFPIYPKTAIAAIVGQSKVESGGSFNTLAYNNSAGGCGAFGVMQWRGTRQTELFAFASSKGLDVTDHLTQIKFIKHELENTFPQVNFFLKNGGLSQYQHSAVIHISYGFGTWPPSAYVLSITDLATWIKAYEDRGGKNSSIIPTRYQRAKDAFALL